MRLKTYALAAALATAADRPAAEVLLCSLGRSEHGPQRGTAEYARYLVQESHVIVRAVALRAGEGETFLVPPAALGMGSQPRAVEFQVREVLRGQPIGSRLFVGGRLSEEDDFNPKPVPYAWPRREGLRGSCFAEVYRSGGEFLFLLKRHGRHVTPYWAPLAPVNEQLRGPDDPWLAWVRQELDTARRAGKRRGS